MPRAFELYLNDIRRALEAIQRFTKDHDEKRFTNDEMRLHSVLYNLMVIGEAVKNLPDEMQEQIPSVPWRDIERFRDKLVHHYFSIRPEIVWQIVQEDLPLLSAAATKLLDDDIPADSSLSE